MQKASGTHEMAPRMSAAPPAAACEAAETTGRPRRLAATDLRLARRPARRQSQGRIPKGCSAACRQRAWEQSRAAASGLSAVQVVERRVDVPVPAVPKRADWPGLLLELVRQIDDGRIYDRDLDELAATINAVVDACVRRPAFRRHPGRASGCGDRGRRGG
jgi:hypothetical protein